MIKYASSTNDDRIDEWRDLVLAFKIHFRSGDSGIIEVCSDPLHLIYAAAMAWDDSTGFPIGVSFITEPMFGCNLMVYVKSPYRRQGIGTELIKRVRRCRRRSESCS